MKILQIKKRIVKSTISILSFSGIFGEKGTETVYLCFRKSVILDIGRQHGGNIAVIKAFQKSIARLTDIFIFTYQRSVDKYPALFLVGESTLGDQTLYPGCQIESEI